MDSATRGGPVIGIGTFTAIRMSKDSGRRDSDAHLSGQQVAVAADQFFQETRSNRISRWESPDGGS